MSIIDRIGRPFDEEPDNFKAKKDIQQQQQQYEHPNWQYSVNQRNNQSKPLANREIRAMKYEH